MVVLDHACQAVAGRGLGATNVALLPNVKHAGQISGDELCEIFKF